MSAPYRKVRVKSLGAEPRLDADAILGAVLAADTIQGPGTIAFTIFIALFGGVGSFVLGFVLVWDKGPLILLAPPLLLGFSCLIVFPWMMAKLPWRIEVREKGLVYTWRHPNRLAHGTRARLIPWEDVESVESFGGRRVTVYWLKLRTGESIRLGYADEQIVTVTREIMRSPESRLEDDEIHKLNEIDKDTGDDGPN